MAVPRVCRALPLAGLLLAATWLPRGPSGALADTARSQPKEYRVVCYFYSRARSRTGAAAFRPEHVDPALCTHIVYQYAVLDQKSLTIKMDDAFSDIDKNLKEGIMGLKRHGVKISLALGGWEESTAKYSKLVNDPEARGNFVSHTSKLLEEFGFDGLHLVWMHPKCWQNHCEVGPTSDKPAFGELAKELAEALRPLNLLVSAFVSQLPTVIDAGYAAETLGSALDWMDVYSYDYHGSWDGRTGHTAPLYAPPGDDGDYRNVNYTINYWISAGVPSRKLVVGLPAYGRPFHLFNKNSPGLGSSAGGSRFAGKYGLDREQWQYREICELIKDPGWKVVQDLGGRMGPYAYFQNDWVSYDDPEMLKKKCEYVKANNLGGVSLWSLDQEDFSNSCGNGKYPLLNAIHDVLLAPSA